MMLCVKYEFLGVWQVFITGDLPSPECYFKQNLIISDMHKGARMPGLEIHLGGSQLWHFRTSFCTCQTDDGLISPTMYLMYILSFILEFVFTHKELLLEDQGNTTHRAAIFF